MSAGLCYGKQLAMSLLTAQSLGARAQNVNLDTNNHKRREDEQSTTRPRLHEVLTKHIDILNTNHLMKRSLRLLEAVCQ